MSVSLNQHSESSPVTFIEAHPVFWATYQTDLKPNIAGEKFPSPCFMMVFNTSQVPSNQGPRLFKNMNHFSVSEQIPEVPAATPPLADH